MVVYLQPLSLGVREGRGWAHSIARPWVPISSPLTHLSLIVFELFGWLQKHLRPPAGPPVRPSARPSDPDTMTSTALEATASSSGTNGSHCSVAQLIAKEMSYVVHGIGQKLHQIV